MLTSPRLPGPTEFAFPGSGSNQIMPLLSRMPVPGTTTREPHSDTAVFVSDTMLRCLSMTDRCVVHSSVRRGVRPGAGLPRRISAATSRA